MYKLPYSLGIAIIATCISCASIPYNEVANHNNHIDYSNLNNWASHPDKQDAGDRIPQMEKEVVIKSQKDLEVDVFFVHPTTYTKKAHDGSWNADITYQKLNDQTDNSTIQFQASIFNQVGRLYAPRYRQAHIQSYFVEQEKTGKKALEFAYEDVKDAFEYYLEHENNNRPFIIASHSQGTTHSARLIQELINGKPIQDQLIAAYLIGMPIPKNTFTNIKPCEDHLATNCIISWRTFQENYIPEGKALGDSILVTNPLSWKISDEKIDREYHQGAILRNFDKRFPNLIDARVHNGMLWTNRPKFPFSFLFTRKDYHIADMNFFYFDIQENAKQRAAAFLKKT